MLFIESHVHRGARGGRTQGLAGSPGEGNGSPLQYSCLGNPTDRGTWRATVHGVVRTGHSSVAKPHHQSLQGPCSEISCFTSPCPGLARLLSPQTDRALSGSPRRGRHQPSQCSSAFRRYSSLFEEAWGELPGRGPPSSGQVTPGNSV